MPKTEITGRFMAMYVALPKHIQHYAEHNFQHLDPATLPQLAVQPTQKDVSDVLRCFGYGVINKIKAQVLQGLNNWLVAHEAIDED